MAGRQAVRALAGTATASVVVMAGVGLTAVAAEAAPAAPAAQSRAMIGRDQVIARARTWNPGTPQRVPYSQVNTHNGYRADCSGYASMALGLAGPGLNTVGLAASSVSARINMGDLQTGDLVIDAAGNSNTRHVVIFEGWTDASKRSYRAFEQRGGYGTDYRVLTYGLNAGSEYSAYRPHVLGGGGGTPPPSTGKYWVDTFANATGYGAANTGEARGTLLRGTNYVYCKVWGAEVRNGSSFNHWWLRTDLDRSLPGKSGRGAYVSAYYLKRWGNDVAKDNSGTVIPNC
ncbi:hypothetical protein [Spirillospora sp. CA-294931]|uniref:hypothetical protein n=1 Tax=Spirillospora sp. CA-294931 TaxID=3240042 RepID=UPI003D8ED37E